MKPPICLSRRNLFLVLAGLFLLAGAVGVWLHTPGDISTELKEDNTHRLEVFFEEVAEVASLLDTEQPATAYRELYEERRVIVLDINPGSSLISWNARAFVPDARTRLQLADDTLAEVLSDRGRIYWAEKQRISGGTRVMLFPVFINYPIDNEYLQDYFYFTDGNTELLRKLQPQVVQQKGPQVLPFGPPGQPMHIGFQVDQPSYLDNAALSFAFLLLFIGLVWLVAALRLLLLGHLRSAALADFLTLLIGLVLRLAMLALQWPRTYFDSELFAPELLALNWWNPTLGDLTLNVLFLVWVAILLFTYLPKAQLARWLKQQPSSVGYALVVLATGIFYLAFSGFFALFQQFVLNSKIYYEFADFFQLDVFSFLVFFNLGLVLAVFFILVFLVSGLLLQLEVFQGKKISIPLAIVVLFCGSLALLRPQDERIIPLVYGISLIIIFILRQFVGPTLRFRLLPALAVFTLFAGVTNLAVSISLKAQTIDQLEELSERYAVEKNLITESTFDGVIENIRNDSLLWHTDTTAPRLDNPFSLVSQRIINRHLINSFKQYDIRVFIFKGGRRLDAQFDVSPYNLTEELMRQGRTLSDNLFLVPYRRSITQNIYVGRTPVTSSLYGRIILQIELHPKNFLGGKLYPQLLLDRSIRRRLSLPEGFGVAVYVDKKLSRKEGGEAAADFPLFFPSADSIAVGDTLLQETESAFRMTFRPNQQKVIVARAARRSTFDKLTAFSFLFYFYVLVYLILRFPDGVRYLRTAGLRLRNLQFATRIQLYLIILTLVPLVAIWLFTTPLFERFYLEENLSELRTNLNNVANFLENEPSFIRDLGEGEPPASPIAVDLISRISDILSADLNVYNADGRLYITTRPKIYQLALTSEYLNPTVMQQLGSEGKPFMAADERLGELNYFSGYVPILNNESELLGYLNLPFLAQQDLLRAQLRQFIAYLINVYVVLILILILASLLISSSITNPLRILKAKLDETQLGLRTEPIQWKSSDEIGAIIDSYNQMIGKLEESERRLAKSEREGAWREMARQVAHEIKNPLTPMKLSVQHLIRKLQDSDDPMVQKSVDRLQNTVLVQIDSLKNIANSFSQFAKMSEVKKEPLNLVQLMEEAASLYETSVEIDRNWATDAEIWISGDHLQLQQVVINLIRNGIQANATTLRLGLEEAGTEVTAWVADNGNGIPQEIQQRIFEPNFSTKTSGMGLGLAISRRIVENMNGRIWFVSKEGEGTTFYLRFPIMQEKPPEQA